MVSLGRHQVNCHAGRDGERWNAIIWRSSRWRSAKGYGSPLPVAIYLAVACTISGLTALLTRETKGLEMAAIW